MYDDQFERYLWAAVSGFGFSGLIHAGKQYHFFVSTQTELMYTGLIPHDPLYANLPGGESAFHLKVCIICFFMSQVLALGAEALVATLAKGIMGFQFWRHGFGLRLRLLITALWVVVWFVLATYPLGNVLRQLGLFRFSPVPFSIVSWQSGNWSGVVDHLRDSVVQPELY